VFEEVGEKMPLAVGPFLAAVRQSAIMADEDTKR
jgi:hypothetical protein